MRSRRPCKQPRCPNLTDSGYCDTHKTLATKNDSLWRGTPAERGYDHRWRKLRVDALKRDQYLCIMCRADGRATPADDVDHKIPIAFNPMLRLDIDNLQSLCREHHAKKTAEDLRKYGNSSTSPRSSG
jgi:5-methylcytosine-specific restriction protein A